MSISAGLLGLSVSTAHGVGLAVGAGVEVVDNLEDRLGEDLDQDDVEISTESMVGPLLSVGLRGGDWVDHQLRVQFASSRGPITATQATGSDPESVSGSTSVSTLGVGYQIGLDVFGKEGRHRLSPCVAVGFVLGQAWIRVRAESEDPDVQSDLEDQGADDLRSRGTTLILHALAGVRVRVTHEVGIRAVLARATTGGISMWQPQVVADVTPGRRP